MLAVTAAVIPYFCTDKCEIWLGKAVTNFIFRAYWCKNQSFDRRLNEIPACCHADTGQSFLPGNNSTPSWSRHASNDRRETCHTDRGGPSHFCIRLTFSHPISSLLLPLEAVENLWEMPLSRVNAYKSTESNQITNITATFRACEVTRHNRTR